MENNRANLPFLVMLFFVAAGLYFRLKGLGKWSFTNDEYYLAQSVRHILETGLPEFKCGGYYVRGLLYQYLVAPFIAMGSNPEWTFRLVPFFSHVIALPGLYKLSTRVSGKFVALVMVSVFSLSTIEIEISRFARMYLPFQALFIWYLYFLYRAIIEKDSRAYPWMFALSFVSPFIFEGGIFLTILNFLPFIKAEKISLKFLGISVFIFAFSYFYLSFDFRHFPHGLSGNWPSDIPMPTNEEGGRIYKPYLLIAGFLNNPLWILPFLLPLVLSVKAAFQISRNSELILIAKLSLILCLLFSVFNLFTLVAVVILVVLLLDLLEPGRLKSGLLKALVLPVAVNISFWLIYGLANPGDYGPLAVLLSGGHVENLIEVIFNKVPAGLQFVSNLLNLFLVLFYPIIGLLGILYVWLKVYPLIILALGAFILFSLYFMIQKADDRYCGYRFLFAVFIINAVMVGILSIDTGTRFTFFLYPVFLLLAIDSIKQLSDRFLRDESAAKVATLCIFCSIFVMSKDFNLNHILNIDSEKVNFRQTYTKQYTGHYILRRDYRGVAEFINKEASDEDIIISTLHPVLYYTDKADYVFFGHEFANFSHYIACEGKKDLWTNRPLIYRKELLFDLVDNAKRDVWIVLNIKHPRNDEVEVLNKYRSDVYYTARDGILGVIKINRAAYNAVSH